MERSRASRKKYVSKVARSAVLRLRVDIYRILIYEPAVFISGICPELGLRIVALADVAFRPRCDLGRYYRGCKERKEKCVVRSVREQSNCVLLHDRGAGRRYFSERFWYHFRLAIRAHSCIGSLDIYIVLNRSHEITCMNKINLIFASSLLYRRRNLLFVTSPLSRRNGKARQMPRICGKSRRHREDSPKL